MQINICLSCDDKYAQYAGVVIASILANAKDNENLCFYILDGNISEDSKNKLKNLINIKPCEINFIEVKEDDFKDYLKINNHDYISIATYYRLKLSTLLPNIDRIIYLDCDVIVNSSLADLFNTDLDNNVFAGVLDIDLAIRNNPTYINAGVLLMDLKKVRELGIEEKFLNYAINNHANIELGDQGIINDVLKNQIKIVDPTYNVQSACFINRSSFEKKPIIVHYVGSKKPWHLESTSIHKELYFKYLDLTSWKLTLKEKLKLVFINNPMSFIVWFKHRPLFFLQSKFWKAVYKTYKYQKKRKIKVGLIIDEFFGGAGTAYGGYGFLARKYICKYIPNKDIQIDVLLCRGKGFWAKKYQVDNVDLYELPKYKSLAKKWLKKQNYDVYLSIELVNDFVLKMEKDERKKLILWIQDPRPQYEWDEINTVNLLKESCYYNQNVYDLVHKLYKTGRVRFISQGYFLNQKAIDLYNLNNNVNIQYLPNPVEIDEKLKLKENKNKIIFLGRIESVKRGWLFCEIAKRMPQYEFYVLGQTFREKDRNSKVMSKYQNIKNLHFAGHVDGKEKELFLKEAKILVNTSIHEALPVSFLEALANKVLLVSNRNPENLTSKFGIWVGNVLGDGFDKVELYCNAIEKIMTDNLFYEEKAQAGFEYVNKIHNVNDFIKSLRQVIIEEANYAKK